MTPEERRAQLLAAIRKRWGNKTHEQRFWEKVDKSGDCWIWTGQRSNVQYGLFWIGHKAHNAHRLAYRYIKGEIPEGLELDHLCRTPLCVNPDHLEPVTHAENMRRAVRTKYRIRNACKFGHDWSDPRNVYIRKDGRRWCAECNRTRWDKKSKYYKK